MLALTSTQENLWWGAVIGGFVVVLAVAALLTILVLLVRTIDRRVIQIRDTLQQAAANTADTALIAETALLSPTSASVLAATHATCRSALTGAWASLCGPGVDLPDEEAQKLQTVGQAVDYVSSHQ